MITESSQRMANNTQGKNNTAKYTIPFHAILRRMTDENTPYREIYIVIDIEYPTSIIDIDSHKRSTDK